MRLWVQMIAAACHGEAPFPAIAEAMLAGFLSWVEANLAIDETADRQAVAAMIVAAVDGLAIIDIGRGPDLAGRASLAIPYLGRLG